MLREITTANIEAIKLSTIGPILLGRATTRFLSGLLFIVPFGNLKKPF
jgi:hypothetical protein